MKILRAKDPLLLNGFFFSKSKIALADKNLWQSQVQTWILLNIYIYILIEMRELVFLIFYLFASSYADMKCCPPSISNCISHWSVHI